MCNDNLSKSTIKTIRDNIVKIWYIKVEEEFINNEIECNKRDMENIKCVISRVFDFTISILISNFNSVDELQFNINNTKNKYITKISDELYIGEELNYKYAYNSYEFIRNVKKRKFRVSNDDEYFEEIFINRSIRKTAYIWKKILKSRFVKQSALVNNEGNKIKFSIEQTIIILMLLEEIVDDCIYNIINIISDTNGIEIIRDNINTKIKLAEKVSIKEIIEFEKTQIEEIKLLINKYKEELCKYNCKFELDVCRGAGEGNEIELSEEEFIKKGIITNYESKIYLNYIRDNKMLILKDGEGAGLWEELNLALQISTEYRKYIVLYNIKEKLELEIKESLRLIKEYGFEEYQD